MIEKIDLIKKVYELCEEHNCKLLYLSYGGSHLYGTSTPTSDIDIIGVFLPPKNRLLLGEKITYIKYDTKKDTERNYQNDIDIKLFSLQDFLKRLLLKCDTNSLDLLYSYTNKSNILASNGGLDPSDVDVWPRGIMQRVFDNRHYLFEIQKVSEFSYVDFAISQAKRYGLRGYKLGTIKKVLEYINYLFRVKEMPETSRDFILENVKLIDCVDNLIQIVGESEYLKKDTLEYPGYLILAKKKHMLTINMLEFKNRVQLEHDRYGDRSNQAEINDGKDWKALSHALRAIYQMEELSRNGDVTFPLKNANLLRSIKLGELSIQQVDVLIDDGLKRLQGMKSENCAFRGIRDENRVNNLILDAYDY